MKAVVTLAQSLGKEARAVAEVAIIQGIRYDHHAFHTLPTDLNLGKAFNRELNGKLLILILIVFTRSFHIRSTNLVKFANILMCPLVFLCINRQFSLWLNM